MLELRIPFGGSQATGEPATIGFAFAAGSTHYSAPASQDWFKNPIREDVPASPALTETPFLRAGFTLDGNAYTKFDYVRMTPESDRLGGFFEGDMDGGEIFIFGAVIGAGLALFYLLNEEYGADDETTFRSPVAIPDAIVQ